MKNIQVFFLFLLGIFVSVGPALASTGSDGPIHSVANTFLWLALILLAARISALVERLGQPAFALRI